MDNRVFQNLVEQTKGIVNTEFGIMDDTGSIVVCSNSKKVNKVNEQIGKILEFKNQVVKIGRYVYQKIYNKNKVELIVYIEYTDENSITFLSLISLNVANIKSNYDEKHDRLNFMKNIIMDNIMPGEISVRAKELRIMNNVFRAILLIKTDKIKDGYAHEIIEGLFPDKLRDTVLILDYETTVLIRELKAQYEYGEINKTAMMIINTINTELMTRAVVGIGSVVENIKDIGRAFKEAQMALLIGGIFDSDKPIISYNNLGIGRLIYQLPTTLCKLFLKEVFKEGSFEALDAETIFTIQKFFENNLNVSETSRQLYVHRNTLVYRLDKIQKITGLDLRLFDDAIIFKVAMLVKKYLEKERN